MLIAAFLAVILPNQIQGAMVRELIERYVRNLGIEIKTQNPPAGFQDLEPLKLEDMSRNVVLSKIMSKFALRNLQVNGLRHVKLIKATHNGRKGKMVVFVKSLESNVGQYALQLGADPVLNNKRGKADLKFKDVTMEIPFRIVRMRPGRRIVVQCRRNPALITVEKTHLWIDKIGKKAVGMKQLRRLVRNKYSQDIYMAFCRRLKWRVLQDAKLKARIGKQAAVIDRYLDVLMPIIRVLIKKFKLDPFRIPSFEKSFKVPILGVEMRGGIRVQGGAITGLGTIHRAGTAKVKLNNPVVGFVANLGFNNVKAAAKAKAWFQGITIRPHVQAHIKKVIVTIEAVQNLNLQRGPELRKFRITVGRIKVTIANVGFLGRILAKILTFVGNKFKSILVGLGQKQLKKLISRQLAKIKIRNLVG